VLLSIAMLSNYLHRIVLATFWEPTTQEKYLENLADGNCPWDL